MAEEKDRADKENKEASLEEQLLALLRDIPATPPEAKPAETGPEAETPGGAGGVVSRQSLDAPPLSGSPLPPLREDVPAPGSPLASELSGLFGGKPPGQAPPGQDRLGPSPQPPGAGHAPASPNVSDQASGPALAAQISELFGQPPKKVEPSGGLPRQIGAAQSMGPAVSSPPPGTVSSPTSVPEFGPPLAGPVEREVFGTEVIEGPRPARGFGPLRSLQRHVVSLSIEGTNLRVLTVTGKSVETWFSAPLNPVFFREGYVANSSGLSEAIGKALKARGVGGGRTVCAFTSLGSVHRLISIPQAAKKDLVNIVPRELRRAAINVDNYSVTWQVLPGKSGTLQVYIIGVPKEPLIAFVEALRLAGIKPLAVDIKPLALARAVNRKDAIIAHGERDTLELAIVVDNVPALMRSIYLGVDTTPPQVASRLAEEVERTVDFYNGTHRSAPLPSDVPIYVTGEVAAYPRFAENLMPTLGRNVATLEPPLSLPKGLPGYLFAVNIGLALKKV